jgi:transcription initiation factor TFIIB
MKCPECGNTNIRETMQEKICGTCGLVLEDMPIEHATPINPVHPFLLQAGSRAQNGRFYKSSWFLSTREKNLQHGLSKIDVIASKLPESIIKESKILFKKALYVNASIGRDNLSLCYASVYIACNVHGVPKTPFELTAYSEITIPQLMKAYKLIKKLLYVNTTPIDPLDLLPRFASKLELRPDTINLIAELLIQTKRSEIFTGRKPEVILAGTIYHVCKRNNDHRTQRQIANSIGVLEVTIRRAVKDLEHS